MTDITHRGIADRIREIEDQKDAAVNAILKKRKAERDSLQEACGAIGHIWSRPPCGSNPNSDFWAANPRSGEQCCICEKDKPKP